MEEKKKTKPQATNTTAWLPGSTPRAPVRTLVRATGPAFPTSNPPSPAKPSQTREPAPAPARKPPQGLSRQKWYRPPHGDLTTTRPRAAREQGTGKHLCQVPCPASTAGEAGWPCKVALAPSPGDTSQPRALRFCALREQTVSCCIFVASPGNFHSNYTPSIARQKQKGRKRALSRADSFSIRSRSARGLQPRFSRAAVSLLHAKPAQQQLTCQLPGLLGSCIPERQATHRLMQGPWLLLLQQGS